MKVSQFYPDNTIRGKVCILAGSGPSAGLYTKEFFDLFPVISLNDTHRHVPVKPTVAFSNHLKFVDDLGSDVCRVVKGRLKWQEKPSPFKHHDNHVPWSHPELYVFSYFSRDLGDERDHFDECELWADPNRYWNTPKGSVSIFAMQFALLSGVAGLILVGCDASPVNGHYVKTKDTRAIMHGYDAYVRGNMRMIREARERFNVPIVSCTPWSGLDNPRERFLEMREWQK